MDPLLIVLGVVWLVAFVLTIKELLTNNEYTKEK